jgi:hypothetical protein
MDRGVNRNNLNVSLRCEVVTEIHHHSSKHTFSIGITSQLFDLLVPKDIEIIWLSNLLFVSVPDESYSRNMSCTLN